MPRLILAAAVIALLAVVVAVLAVPAASLPPDGFPDEGLILSAPVDVRRGTPGSEVGLDRQITPPALRGLDCQIHLAADNGQSVHPTNAIIIRSGTSSDRFENVESIPNTLIDDNGTITLGDDVAMTLELGPSGVSSAGFIAYIGCPTPPTTTTTAPPTTIIYGPPPTTLPPAVPETNPPVTVPTFTG